MGVIDFLILLALAAGVITGFMAGLTKQITSIVGIFVAIIVTRIFGTEATELLAALVPELKSIGEVLVSVLAHIVLFCFVYLSVRLIGYMMKSLLHSLKLGAIDKLGGVLFGVFKYILALSIVLNIWLIISPESPLVTNSELLGDAVCRFVVDMAPWLFDSELIPKAAEAIQSAV